MDLWKYYDGDLKYPNVTMYSHEKEIAKANLKWAFDYVSKHGKDKELESIIAKNPYYSYNYANHILKGEFPLGEPVIAKDMDFSYAYAMLINRRFELGELQIAKNPYYSYRYAKIILNGPFKLGEPAIAKDSYYSYDYAKEALDGKPFPLGEPAIAKDNEYSKRYTQEVLKKDFYLDGKLICKYEG